MTPEDMAKLISEMEAMPVAQKEQLKSMGMDPDTSEYSNIWLKVYKRTVTHLIMLTIHSACEYEDDERQSTDDGNSSKTYE